MEIEWHVAQRNGITKLSRFHANFNYKYIYIYLANNLYKGNNKNETIGFHLIDWYKDVLN